MERILQLAWRLHQLLAAALALPGNLLALLIGRAWHGGSG
jgi:hypothetical protein